MKIANQKGLNKMTKCKCGHDILNLEKTLKDKTKVRRWFHYYKSKLDDEVEKGLGISSTSAHVNCKCGCTTPQPMEEK